MEEIEGVVVKIYGLYYTVQREDRRINCVLRGRIRQDRDMVRFSNPVAVGDMVKFELNDDGGGVINQVQKRMNFFSRKEKGRNRKEDIIASNLDIVVIVQSFRNPDLNLRFVDRLAVRSGRGKIPVLLCINKMDLADSDLIEYVHSYYLGAGIQIAAVCAITGGGIPELLNILTGKISLFVGGSGVGKSTILNRISPGLNLRVSEISRSTNKGRHTTSNAEMLNISPGTFIIDTPGVREFGLTDIEPQELRGYFYEFNKYIDKCGYKQCTHDHEPDCEVKRKVEKGKIFEDRYISYLNILESLREYREARFE